jgi:hypothetical protein
MSSTQASNLLSDVILKNGIIEHIGSDRPPVLFAGLTFSRLFFIVIVPVIMLLFIAFILKKKYDAKKAKDDITLNGFYKPID